MRYEVRLRETKYGAQNGYYVADIYRIEWFGWKRTLIREGVEASDDDCIDMIRIDFIKQMGGVEYDEYGPGGDCNGSYIIPH